MKGIIFLTAGLLAVFFIIQSFTAGTDSVQLDGVIHESEWRDAIQFDLENGGKVLIKKTDNELYVGLKAQQKAWAHVYLLHGDTVRVLHASAALGEARYVRKAGSWQNVQTFNWELRERNFNDDLLRKQQAHYLRNGWVSNNNNTGNGMTFEFKVDLTRTDNRPLPFACVVAEVPFSLHYFPATLNDHTILQRLVQGYTPDSLKFNPGSWQRID
jgi:hypothetical protein